MSKVLVPLANGFEEIEAMSILDVLKRADIDVDIVGLNTLEVEGANTGLKVKVEKLLEDVKVEEIEMIVLPGGLPGADHLAKSEKIKEILQHLDSQNKKIGAICAAPWALREAGVLKDRYTCYPSFEKTIGEEGYISDEKVVFDQNIITSRGPATAICFALEIVKEIKGQESYDATKSALLVDFC